MNAFLPASAAAGKERPPISRKNVKSILLTRFVPEDFFNKKLYGMVISTVSCMTRFGCIFLNLILVTSSVKR